MDAVRLGGAFAILGQKEANEAQERCSVCVAKPGDLAEGIAAAKHPSNLFPLGIELILLRCTQAAFRAPERLAL